MNFVRNIERFMDLPKCCNSIMPRMTRDISKASRDSEIELDTAEQPKSLVDYQEWRRLLPKAPISQIRSALSYAIN
jgi:hypothetical protein